MNEWLWFLYFFLVCQRLMELIIAKNNEKWMISRGGYEVGEKHYKYFIVVHSLFFVVLLSEGLLVNPATLSFMLVVIFIIIQLGRIWCLLSLGRFWNTKIIILPGSKAVQKGPYRYIKHPNYIIVGLELFFIPLMYGAYFTAIIFPLLHLVLLKTRIPIENQAIGMLLTHKFKNPSRS